MRHLNNSLYLGPTRLKKSPKTERKTAKNQQLKNAIFTHKNTPQPAWLRGFLHGDPGGIRTPDPRLRRPLLYPTELLNHINLERAMGIEPTTSAWKAEVLPLNYTRMVGVAGFEPATPCSQGRCATKLRYTPNTKGIILFN